MSVRITTNSAEVGKEFAGLFTLEKINNVLKAAAFDTVAIVSDRVQQQGKGAAGQTLQTRSKTRQGRYSKAYGDKREAAGRQTKIVDLTFTGDMLGDYVPAQVSEKEWLVGFRGTKTAQKSEYVEAYYGDIFSLSPSEFGDVEKTIDEAINEIS